MVGFGSDGIGMERGRARVSWVGVSAVFLGDKGGVQYPCVCSPVRMVYRYIGSGTSLVGSSGRYLYSYK